MKKLTLKLNECRPDTLPMKRLGQYLVQLSDLLGAAEYVHFTSVGEGSAMLNVDIQDAKYDQVLMHVREAPQGMGSKKRRVAYESLQKLMQEDGTGGALLDAGQTALLSFRTPQKGEKPLFITKRGTVQGRLYLVGGKDDTIPVRLEGPNGQTLHCEASTELAQKLSIFLFRQIQVSGQGIWERSVEGQWRLKKLKIETFTELDTSKTSTVLENMRALSGLKWASMEDPHGAARDLRS